MKENIYRIEYKEVLRLRQIESDSDDPGLFRFLDSDFLIFTSNELARGEISRNLKKICEVCFSVNQEAVKEDLYGSGYYFEIKVRENVNVDSNQSVYVFWTLSDLCEQVVDNCKVVIDKMREITEALDKNSLALYSNNTNLGGAFLPHRCTKDDVDFRPPFYIVCQCDENSGGVKQELRSGHGMIVTDIMDEYLPYVFSLALDKLEEQLRINSNRKDKTGLYTHDPVYMDSMYACTVNAKKDVEDIFANDDAQIDD